MLNWMSRTALEVISQGGLGVSIDPLTRDTTDEYTQALKDLMFVPLSSRNMRKGSLLQFFHVALRCMVSAPSALCSPSRALANWALLGSGGFSSR